MPWGLILTLLGVAVVITLLMRPDIFLAVLRGGGEKREQRKVLRPRDDRDFQAGIKNPSSEKRDEHHG